MIGVMHCDPLLARDENTVTAADLSPTIRQLVELVGIRLPIELPPHSIHGGEVEAGQYAEVWDIDRNCAQKTFSVTVNTHMRPPSSFGIKNSGYPLFNEVRLTDYALRKMMSETVTGLASDGTDVEKFLDAHSGDPIIGFTFALLEKRLDCARVSKDVSRMRIALEGFLGFTKKRLGSDVGLSDNYASALATARRAELAASGNSRLQVNSKCIDDWARDVSRGNLVSENARLVAIAVLLVVRGNELLATKNPSRAEQDEAMRIVSIGERYLANRSRDTEIRKITGQVSDVLKHAQICMM